MTSTKIIFVTEPDGNVRPATSHEEDVHMEAIGADHPVSQEIMAARKAAAKPAETGPPKTPQSRAKKTAKAKESEAGES